MSNATQLNYHERAALCEHPVTRELLTLMADKETNLCVNPDLTCAKDFLAVVDQVGPEICLLKTHIDIIEDFSPALIEDLQALAEKHRFLIFEDRKFADIGSVVKAQYGQGVYRIAEWAHITNAHSVPGPGIIAGLREVGLSKGRGLLLLAEMSSQGSLAQGDYTEATVQMALDNPDFVMGFITQRRLTDDPRFLHMTPGVNLASAGDQLGQRYRSPETAIREQGCDIVIVGRGVYGAADPQATAARYRASAWQAIEA